MLFPPRGHREQLPRILARWQRVAGLITAVPELAQPALLSRCSAEQAANDRALGVINIDRHPHGLFEGERDVNGVSDAGEEQDEEGEQSVHGDGWVSGRKECTTDCKSVVLVDFHSAI
mgnify:CR=1 FL=1